MKYTIEDLLEIMKKLRSPEGCPWDKVQTHQSIKKSMIEECYEAIDALDNGTDKDFANELGDVLLQVVFHSQLASERGAFDFGDVVDEICTKLITRHTHVFGNDKADGEKEALENWEKNKKKEKGLKTYTEMLEDVPGYLPALMRSSKLQKKAQSANVGAANSKEAYEYMSELVKEYETASDKEQALGELLFAAVNMGRLDGVDAETALSDASNRFVKRFCNVEERAAEKGSDILGLGEEERLKIWRNFK